MLTARRALLIRRRGDHDIVLSLQRVPQALPVLPVVLVDQTGETVVIEHPIMNIMEKKRGSGQAAHAGENLNVHERRVKVTSPDVLRHMREDT